MAISLHVVQAIDALGEAMETINRPFSSYRRHLENETFSNFWLDRKLAITRDEKVL